MGRRVLAVLLGATLLVLGVVADRALVASGLRQDEARLAEDAETARLTALSVRAALARVEQAVAAGAPPAGVVTWRLASTFELGPPAASSPSIGAMSRADLVKALDSHEVTANGLPLAAVAAVALGDDSALATAAERLVSGALPVRAEDVAGLARALRVPAADARLVLLRTRLEAAPAARSLPTLPAFRRETTDGRVQGWSRGGRERIHYVLDASALLDIAGVGERAKPATPPASGANVVAVPDVSGLVLDVTPPASLAMRGLVLRGVLWAALVACFAGGFVVLRSLDRQARALSREKAFLAGVTHELRTPLAAIRLFGETLAEGRGEPREYGRLVAQESERLDSLVERVLTTTRADFAPCFAWVEPGALAASVVELMRPKAASRGVTLALTSADEVAATWDEDAVRRALANLVDNAIKHGPAGGRVDVSVRVVGPDVRLGVRDDGAGVRRRDRARIFGRFERGDTEASGTGLGLYLAEQVARAHGGRIDLDVGEGGGCEFALVLAAEPGGAPRAVGTAPAVVTHEPAP